ncbi:hypothetical protein XENTR_v10020948 [Xenopus tropicalis]|nr:hypothetical protein XENTR_v10020948 [Xenopus tropicalis]
MCPVTSRERERWREMPKGERERRDLQARIEASTADRIKRLISKQGSDAVYKRTPMGAIFMAFRSLGKPAVFILPPNASEFFPHTCLFSGHPTVHVFSISTQGYSKINLQHRRICQNDSSCY